MVASRNDLLAQALAKAIQIAEAVNLPTTEIDVQHHNFKDAQQMQEWEQTTWLVGES